MFAITIKGDLRRVMEANITAVGQAVTAAVTETAEIMKNEMRSQVISAGLGQRLANSWRSKVYPNSGDNAAAKVYSTAPVIMGAFSSGALITARNATWLAIPTQAAPKTVLGKRVTPAAIEQAWGITLRFVYRQGRSALLVADVKTGYGTTGVAMFTLVRQVSLRKLLDLDRAKTLAAAHLKAALASRLNP